MTNLILGTALAFFQDAAAPTVAREAQEQVMTGGGWLFMSAAWVFILTLVLFTFSKVLRGGKR
jgi:choline-glycine betaine transporter